MNTRLQVEHPVTEWVNGLDLVEMQLLLASGELELPKQESIQPSGSSIEVRIYAEDPHNFLPAPGKMGKITQPNGPFLRWDSSYETSGEVSMFYDPMIAKLSVWGRNRDEAVARIRVALDELSIEAPKNARGQAKGSLKTNVTFLQKLARCEDTIKGNTTTDLIPRNPTLTESKTSEKVSDEAAIAMALLRLTEGTDESASAATAGVQSLWEQKAKWEALR
jgi:acetyl/propionyl-CoA carboxylase alpha subunit